MRIDFNCDLGEGTARDGELMAFVTSANIACGGHAGDEATMREAVAAARRHGVGIGAHPGYADRANFGRRELGLTPRELARLLLEQIDALRALGPVRHVKPHGALYTLAARDRAVADVVVNAIIAVDPALILFAPAGSQLVAAGRVKGLQVAQEVFADRTYQPDGSLTPRTQPGAVITDVHQAVAQARRMVSDGCALAQDGSQVPLTADTLCVHGDGARATEFVRALREALVADGVELRTFGT
ncbi:MAG TPA: 5-oxoprolinase subunit PxpA [Opitutus sp.]|nr:5-oxoprolinase subunit PxpA [Opitutus sp.]